MEEVNNKNVMDVVVVEERELVGVVDFSTPKHIIFYDLTTNENPEVRLVVIIWKLYFSHKRFSIFKSQFFPQVDIGTPILLNKKHTKGIDSMSLHSKPPKRHVVGRLTV
jgi:hypothetical protein